MAPMILWNVRKWPACNNTDCSQISGLSRSCRVWMRISMALCCACLSPKRRKGHVLMEMDCRLKTLLMSLSSTGPLPVNSHGPVPRAKRMSLSSPDAPGGAETRQVGYNFSIVVVFIFLTPGFKGKVHPETHYGWVFSSFIPMSC